MMQVHRPRLAAWCLLASVALAGTVAGREAMSDTDASKVFADARVVAVVDAAARGDEERVRTLGREGADLNAQGERGVTPLEWALLHKDRRAMETLLRAGADPSRPGVGGALCCTWPRWRAIRAICASCSTMAPIPTRRMASPRRRRWMPR